MKIFSITALALTLIGLHSSTKAQETTKPNILFILADDLGYQDVGFNGSKWFETPKLDALAKESAVFQNASMYPTCSPSRTALLTGKHSFRTQVYNVPVLEKPNGPKHNIYSRWTVETKHDFYSKPLRDAGYQLIHLGKWHVVGPYPEKEKNYPFKKKLKQPANGSTAWLEKHKTEYLNLYYPIAKGFHENVGGTFWGDPSRGYKAGYNAPSGGYIAPFNNPFIKDPKEGTWLTDYMTDEAIRFMKDSTKPFFVNLHYYSPHRPSIATGPEMLKKYIEKAKDEGTGQHAKATKEIAAYATMVENIDMNVGRLMDYLNTSGKIDNTVIIFTSDNGYNGIQSHTNQLRGAKGEIYEGGIRVPAIVHWKGKIKPQRLTQNITVLDFFPTFLDLANTNKYTGTMDGNSILPIIEHAEKPDERPLFWHIASTYKHAPCTMMKKGNWKLIQFLNTGKLELYNLTLDPAEKNNLADKSTEKRDELYAEMKTWRETNTVPIPAASKTP
ncbi:MAG: sulfatase [Akkermansiaceae bacterium]